MRIRFVQTQLGDMPLYGISPNNKNNNKNKIRTNSIGDMPLYGISPNKTPCTLFVCELKKKSILNYLQTHVLRLFL